MRILILLPNLSLARGDIILKFAGVELHDIAESRLGGQYAETAMAERPKTAY